MRHYVNDSYQEAEILSASPLQLVRLLYRAAIEAVATARQRLAAGDIAGRSQAINRALRIVTELIFSLDRERNAELSRGLVELYDYVQRLLIDANSRQVDLPLCEAQTLLMTLQEAWETCESTAAAPSSQEPEYRYEPVSCAG